MQISWKKSSVGFYFAALGASFGLGNLWRFPYVVVENGGGAFVLLYLLLVFLVGMPLLMGELLLGRVAGDNLVSVTKHLDGFNKSKRDYFLRHGEKYFTRLAVVVCLIVLAYFSVISGWVLHYGAGYTLSIFSFDDLVSKTMMSSLRDNGWLQIALTGLHLIIVLLFVARRVKKNLEKWVGYIMPAFIILLVGLMIKSISLETSPEAIRFFLYPDFSKIKWSSLSYAVGHVLFSLSLAFGTMVTFRRFLRGGDDLLTVGFRVATIDSLLSIFSGFLIFPLVILGTIHFSGPELLFQTVPIFLDKIPNGTLFGIGFFLLLYLAALGSSIGLLETVIDNIKGYKRIGRAKSAIIAGIFCFLLSIVPALSSSVLKDVSYNNKGVLELLDIFIINWVLPISALFLSQLIYYGISENKKEEVFLLKTKFASQKIFNHWKFSLKWMIPIIIGTSLILEIYDFFTKF